MPPRKRRLVDTERNVNALTIPPPRDGYGHLIDPDEPCDHPAHTASGQIELIPGSTHVPTLERRAFVDGLLDELHSILHRHLGLVRELHMIEGKMTVTERNLQTTRDHLYQLLEETDEEVPEGWRGVLEQVRFVGVRLSEACITLLEERGSASISELESALNEGQFRFRTSTPLREIHAALIRQTTRARRVNNRWEYIGEEKKGVA